MTTKDIMLRRYMVRIRIPPPAVAAAVAVVLLEEAKAKEEEEERGCILRSFGRRAVLLKASLTIPASSVIEGDDDDDDDDFDSFRNATGWTILFLFLTASEALESGIIRIQRRSSNGWTISLSHSR
jgi:trehalose-6-phosphatase